MDMLSGRVQEAWTVGMHLLPTFLLASWRRASLSILAATASFGATFTSAFRSATAP